MGLEGHDNSKIMMHDCCNIPTTEKLTMIKAEDVQLEAETVWGAMHGLETFSQLVYVIDNELMVPADIYIEDGPIFPHRGVLLDTGRNYFAPRDIMRLIRAMSYNKLNVFHWHVTDSHSFPIVLPSEPELANKGSYGSKMQYSPAVVRAIVEYGMSHGVRVMPEIDTPAHTGSWAGAYPDIITCEDTFWLPSGSDWVDRLAAEPGTGQLNPLNPQTYEVVNNMIKDTVSLFPENFFHAGADEVTPACWKTDPSIQKFLSNNSTLNEILELYINRTYPYIRSHNRTVVYWEDVLLDSAIHVDESTLPKETTILQSWNNGSNNTKRIVSAGYRAIVSSADFYYLDCGHGAFMGNDSRYDKQLGDDEGVPFNYKGGSGGSWCGPFKTWQRIYSYDITHGLREEEAKLVIGGEVALWAEQADPTVMDAMIWPRASAMAEVLWSGNRDENGNKRFAEAIDRLNEWRYRMVGRAIGAEPLQPLWCVRNPGMCNFVQ
ncbi:beta-hexosaminidase 2-like isoform X2 [Asparagus officinalis]|nr:beta-hexosaminidase 2-like isoform X2 [Asparagus officinalis]XP_020257134.1 beta-hexosaminidase 2-like isoform X2 [Asparagus officinalis]XP_020257135.1 beta-hexosaminidase 2-like isoform X2 [Asparagus officinalis]XP_020257136.1 beta-hexosaminidase 2-like isoform X2 [Asparagus officinalis]